MGTWTFLVESNGAKERVPLAFIVLLEQGKIRRLTTEDAAAVKATYRLGGINPALAILKQLVATLPL